MSPALLLTLCLASADGGMPPDAGLPAPPAVNAPMWLRVGVATAEGVALDFGFLAFSNLVTQQSFAQVSGDTIVRNLTPPVPWTFDGDYFVTNQFGHPLQGALHFTAARSAGLGFWGSALFTSLASLWWELFFETEKPSVNDQFTTSIGGTLLGETLHRTALSLRVKGGGLFSKIVAWILDPFGGINLALLGTGDEVEVPQSISVRFEGGVMAAGVFSLPERALVSRSPLQARVAVQLVSGMPWDEDNDFERPFRWYELRADLAFPRDVVGNVFIRGSLWARRLGQPDSPVFRGLFGIMGAYDYGAPSVLRASAVGFGPGTTLQWAVGEHGFVQLTAFLGVSPLASAGQLQPRTPEERDYHVGPALQSVLGLTLGRCRWYSLEFLVRHWLVGGVYVQPYAYESITYFTTSLLVPIWRWFGVSAEVTLASRRAGSRDSGGTFDRDTGATVRVSGVVMSDAPFGAFPEGH